MVYYAKKVAFSNSLLAEYEYSIYLHKIGMRVYFAITFAYKTFQMAIAIIYRLQ